MGVRVQNLSFFFFVAWNTVFVVYLLPTITDLTCPKDGSDILIDDIGYETQSFRFPPAGSAGFPKGWTCNWKFKAQPGLQLLLQVIDVHADGKDVIKIINSDGSVEDDETGPLTDEKPFEFVVSTDEYFTVQLIADNEGSDGEKLFINTIAGKDSGTCPGTKTISATDKVQYLTSNNFPNSYESDEVCDVTITADEGKVVYYQMKFKNVENDAREKNIGSCRDDFKIFDDYSVYHIKTMDSQRVGPSTEDTYSFYVPDATSGSTKESKVYDNCDIFYPDIMGQSSGRDLRILFGSDGDIEDSGFLLIFIQKDLDECAEEIGPCDLNATCFNTEGSFRCECMEGFIGDGFQCDQVTTTTSINTTAPPLVGRLPIFLAIGTTAVAGGIGLLVLLFGASSNG